MTKAQCLQAYNDIVEFDFPVRVCGCSKEIIPIDDLRVPVIQGQCLQLGYDHEFRITRELEIYDSIRDCRYGLSLTNEVEV